MYPISNRWPNSQHLVDHGTAWKAYSKGPAGVLIPGWPLPPERVPDWLNVSHMSRPPKDLGEKGLESEDGSFSLPQGQVCANDHQHCPPWGRALRKTVCDYDWVLDHPHWSLIPTPT